MFYSLAMKGLLVSTMDGLLVSTVTFLLLVSCKTSIAGDTITPTKSLSHNQTLVSSGQIFELGFFSPDNSNNWYLGIWYKIISNHTVVWIANRDSPLAESSGLLEINENGSLVLSNGSNSIIWSSLNHTSAQNPIAQLLDTGNLILRSEGQDDPESYIWQSFDYPTDTVIAGMKLGWDLRKGLNRKLTSWKSSQDPSTGEFSHLMDRNGSPQLFILDGSVKNFRAGPWNGLRFSGLPDIKNNSVFTPIFVNDDEEVYYSFNSTNSVISRRVLLSSGFLERFVWNNQSLEWIAMLKLPQDHCDTYGLCGGYSTCDTSDAIICNCLNGFTPKSPEAWDQLDWSHGCKRRVDLDCNNGDGFVKYTSLKLPDTSKCLVNKSMTTEECWGACLKNCSCMAYSNSDIRGKGSGCLLWFGDLIDMRHYNEIGQGQDLYVRMAASELIKIAKAAQKRKKRIILIIVVSVILGMLVLGSIIFYFIWKTRMKQRELERGLDLPLFSFDTIASATNNFSTDNKLGEGGYGPVYKGILSTGQEIAAKRLSHKSGQGRDEFKNELAFIAKLQHRNLVRLLGCCIQKEERMLIYEYMPNNSLESFLFDEARKILLDWEKRFHIVVGVAQGLLYLHRDSRLRIIHRDLKAANILLDSEMKPKISDFGMARSFGGDQTEANTRKVVGTYGYMSPEYAIDGRFSMKSDVFSFGVLVLEIVSGTKNRDFFHPDHDLNLLGHAWKLWNENKPLELVDASLEEQIHSYEVVRSIQVGLLCVQQHPEDRPNMSSVVLMLCSESAVLPQPKQPGFYNGRSLGDGKKFGSVNEMSVTFIEGR